MSKSVIILVRVFFAMLLGLAGIFALGQAFATLAFRDFVFFGLPGLMMIIGLLVGAALLYAAARLFKTTLAMPSN